MLIPCLVIRCDQIKRPCAGACLCRASGRDILEHASAAQCPLGRFTCARCGCRDHVEQNCPIPAGYDPKDYRLDSGGSSGCSCA